MRKTVKFGVVRGVPILKDIPLIGFLFSGEDTEQRAVETVFILTPTYSTGGRARKEVMEEIRKKHEPVSSGKLQEAIKGIFGGKSSEKEQQQKALARNAAREAEEQAKRAEAELNRVKAEAEAKIKAAEKAKEEAKKEAERAKKEYEEK
jgi:type II secretory pathway component GspD/PulD (secretin)